MSSILFTACLTGLDCTIIEVEVDFKKGQTHFSVVGLADKSIQEAKDRIPPAIRNSGFVFTPVKIVINLAPAELQKSGPSYDLPLAVGYLVASGQISFDASESIFIGELALDGRIRPVSGILPIADGVHKKGFKKIFVPEENAMEAALIPGIEVYGVSTLNQLILHLENKVTILPTQNNIPEIQSSSITFTSQYDFKNVKGQLVAKRAMEIVAAGGHNILLSGVPGSGKTLLSKCLPTILPSMLIEEALEVTRIYSVSGLTSKNNPIIRQRPFRTPHHTSSQVALVGGGTAIKPGEISLAHRGVLFLDEFPEFSVQALEALRQPLEDKVVTISRASGTLTFPANFILVAAMNPCKCGFAGDPIRECTCSHVEITRYQKKISGPILDRIDLLVNVPKVDNTSLFSNIESEDSQTIATRVQIARNIQQERFKNKNIISNADMSPIEIKEFIELDSESRQLLKQAMDRLNLSARSYYRLLKVARTIADLEGSEKVETKHIGEALSYRIQIGS